MSQTSILKNAIVKSVNGQLFLLYATMKWLVISIIGAIVLIKDASIIKVKDFIRDFILIQISLKKVNRNE
ncbi:hypothetical protein ESCO58_00138 [Escherichia phage vB_EcoM_ESCO58]|nr:hypothetical protein ESCO58_00138 [Escherichia phage vB_EcoM_ESCO58]